MISMQACIDEAAQCDYQQSHHTHIHTVPLLHECVTQLHILLRMHCKGPPSNFYCTWPGKNGAIVESQQCRESI